MQIIDRKTASTNGSTIYFTGKSCKNGHVAYRYVKNGACSECVKAANYRAPDANLTARREARGQMVQVKVRAFASDREGIAIGAYALALLRWPELELSDVDPKTFPTHQEPSGTGLYAFLCHEDDIKALRAIGDAFLSQHKSDVAMRRAQLLGQVLTGSNDDPAPEWKP